MKRKNVIVSGLIKFVILIVFGILCYFNLFQKLDYRLYDSLFHFRKAPEQNENVMLVKIDDPSILDLGEWPWSRDIIADALIRMKEFGAYNAIFDIEYISPSKNGIAPSAEDKISTNLAQTRENITVLLGQLSDSVSHGFYSAEELPELTEMLIDENVNPSFEKLDDYIRNNMARDNDEYFAQALQFFGKAYLTINHENLGYIFTNEEIDYITDRLLLNSVEDDHCLIKLGNINTRKDSEENEGFTPALHKLITRSYNASFTNSVVDSDGVRRRMELLYQYKDKYIPQLAFGPFLDIVDSTDVIRNKDYYIVKNAKNPETGIRSDIKIPVDPNGRILINWRKGSCDEAFKNDSIINIIRLDQIEEKIILYLKNIEGEAIFDNDGFELPHSIDAQKLLDQYDEIIQFKEFLLSKCTGYSERNVVLDGISDDEYKQYFDLRNDYYNNLNSFLNSEDLQIALNRLAELNGEISAEEINLYKDYLSSDFNDLKIEYDTYNTYLEENKKLYKNAYCIIGNTATSTTDTGATPFEKKFMNVGIHANILNTLLTQDFITSIRWYWGFIIAAILSFLMLFFSGSSNTKQNISSLIVYIIYAIAGALLFIFSHYYALYIGCLIYLLTDYIACFAYRFYQSVIEKRFITQIAASFANKDTVEELRKHPEAFKTVGQKKCITALFSDIQKFSTFSESIGKRYGEEGPNKLIGILNEYLGQMSNEILRNNGNIDKYEGDAIISMFGAPDPMNSHSKEEWAYLCLDSAIRMKKVEVEFNQMHEELFKPIEIQNENGNTEIIKLNPLQTRIGINSGDAFVGLMGSKTELFSKLNYTMIGDTVNLASRLEGVNKAYNSWIMCSDATWNLADSGANKDLILSRKLDKVRVVGRSTPVQLYNILGYKNEASNELKEQIEIFNTALDKYFNRDFANAGKLFIQANQLCNGDPTSLIFADRCKKFIENGIPESWDGVINMTSK